MKQERTGRDFRLWSRSDTWERWWQGWMIGRKSLRMKYSWIYFIHCQTTLALGSFEPMTEHSRTTDASSFISELETMSTLGQRFPIRLMEMVSELPTHCTHHCTQQVYSLFQCLPLSKASRGKAYVHLVIHLFINSFNQ